MRVFYLECIVTSSKIRCWLKRCEESIVNTSIKKLNNFESENRCQFHQPFYAKYKFTGTQCLVQQVQFRFTSKFTPNCTSVLYYNLHQSFMPYPVFQKSTSTFAPAKKGCWNWLQIETRWPSCRNQRRQPASRPKLVTGITAMAGPSVDRCLFTQIDWSKTS